MMKFNSLTILPLTLLLPAISLISGFAVAPVILLCFAVLLCQSKKLNENEITCKFFLPEAIFIFWCFCSILWSIETIHTAKYSLSLLFLFVFFVITLNASRNSIVNFGAIEKTIFYGVLIAFGIFTIEYLFNGVLYSSVRLLLSQSVEDNYPLYNMDRGCAFISCISWVVISWLLQRKCLKTAILFVAALITMLALSDSLASFVGFILGLITFSLIYLSRFRILNLMILALIAYSIIMPSFFASTDPRSMVNKYDFLPLSAKHRVFIWNSTAHKSGDNLLIGHGLNNSKYISTTLPTDHVMFQGIKLELLPLHPHNNILQLLLELGVIGLILYICIIIKNLLKVRDVALQHQNIIWGAAAIACFVNYFFVGMVAYNLWQSWWMISALGLIIIFRISLLNSQHKIITH